MSNYDDKISSSFFDDEDEFEEAIGGTQLHADDDDATDALNGKFDDILDDDDELDELMDAEQDVEDVNLSPDEAAVAAHDIASSCTGTLDNGDPKAAIAIALDMINPATFVKQSLSKQGLYKPVVAINSRFDFIEVVFSFPTAVDNGLRVLHANLEKYSQKLNEMTEFSQMVPIMSFTIVPVEGMGCYYVLANNPRFWSLSAEKVNGACNQIKLLFACEDVQFFQTDETDLSDVAAAVIREQEEADEFAAQMAEKEAARYERDFGDNTDIFSDTSEE